VLIFIAIPMQCCQSYAVMWRIMEKPFLISKKTGIQTNKECLWEVNVRKLCH